MSFRCEKCGVAQAPGTRPVRVVTETRRMEYIPNSRTQKKFESTFGDEIAREMDYCKECAT